MQCLSRNINLRKESQTMTNQDLFACKAIPEESVAHITIVLCLKKKTGKNVLFIFLLRLIIYATHYLIISTAFVIG